MSQRCDAAIGVANIQVGRFVLAIGPALEPFREVRPLGERVHRHALDVVGRVEAAVGGARGILVTVQRRLRPAIEQSRAPHDNALDPSGANEQWLELAKGHRRRMRHR